MANTQEHGALDLTLARAAAAFKDADFFESSILFWSAALDQYVLDSETEMDIAAVVNSLDLEQELGLDIQAEEPIDLSFPFSTTAKAINAIAAANMSMIDVNTITPIQTYVLTALSYLARHINIRIDILPSGQNTLTSLGPPQRYYGSLTQLQKQIYHNMLAIVLATTSASSPLSLQKIETMPDRNSLQIQQTTRLGNEASSTWQTCLDQKRTPHNLPRFFSFLNSSSCTVAGCSTPRNEMDIDALEQAGFRLVITLIKESPLSPTWFRRPAYQEGENNDNNNSNKKHPKMVRNAFVPIENKKAPAFPEVFEVLMGWCFRAGETGVDIDTKESSSEIEQDWPLYGHQRATLIHCGGGKGRAGIVLAAHLIRFGLVGHEIHGYCAECIRNDNAHPYDLDQFRKGLGEQKSVASTLPKPCTSIQNSAASDVDEDDEGKNDEERAGDTAGGTFCAVPRSVCLNRYQPRMTAKDAIAHLRALRPGSIENAEQEKAIKAYGDWLWRQSSLISTRSRIRSAMSEENALTVDDAQSLENKSSETASGTIERPKGKEKKKKGDNPTKLSAPLASTQGDMDILSDDECESGGRKPGKKGKKGSRKLPPKELDVFVPPPADRIIKIPGSHHHQHHLVVQHNLRARQLQRGQKSKKNKGGSSGKQSKERPSYNLSGSPLDSAPKLMVLTGLPGSGKSYLATTLLQEFPEHFVRISQDELGSRAVCERLLAQSMRHQQQSLAVRGSKKALPITVIVDRCNPTIMERKEWYEVAFQPDETAMVWFSQSIDKCIERVDSRDVHPTVARGMGSKVVKSFAKCFEPPSLAKEGSWCKTLVEVGDDEGSNQLLEIMRKFAKGIPGSSTHRISTTAGGAGEASTPVKARPAFIPAGALHRKRNGANADAAQTGSSSSNSFMKEASSGNMAVVEEGGDENDENKEEDVNLDGESESDGDNQEEEDSTEDDSDNGEHTDNVERCSLAAPLPSSSTMSITKALQYASLTGHRPAVKKPVKRGWKNAANNATIDTITCTSSVNSGSESHKGVSFATPLSTYDRPLQKFPRTPHLFDPLTILQSWNQRTDHQQTSGNSEKGDNASTGGSVTRRSAAISRSDLILPPSALHQVFAPKPHQVLTVEEKMDGANIGFSVLHFKTMNGFADMVSAGPPAKIRVQNRNHFVHPDDHWQFKKLDKWLERYREDILWLCEGRWRFETQRRQGGANEEPSDTEDDNDMEDEDEDEGETESKDDEEEDEYVDENRVLQDGMASYVLYGEWLYAKHSVRYTGLRSWFIPFDLFDVKTGTFVSRTLFQNAISQTRLIANPVIQIPEDIYGNIDKTLQWALKMLHSRSALMKGSSPSSESEEGSASRDRVEGLYFRIDQGDRLLMRSKAVRSDFIADEERWGTKEQVANQLDYQLAHYYL
ncbi:Dual specificity protein phosphatase 23 [Haplosporangium sp. Z 767]|nr:Dual specificity protein phosphatase 23 [Haplosporangium sp. Z 767]KAF9196836.1 Dual specificity protein phosphatase 23 [Haplosporangium sp. Z 11]